MNSSNDDKLIAFLKAHQPLPPETSPGTGEVYTVPTRQRRKGLGWGAVSASLVTGVFAFWLTFWITTSSFVEPQGELVKQSDFAVPDFNTDVMDLSVSDDESMPVMEIGEDYLELAGAGGW